MVKKSKNLHILLSDNGVAESYLYPRTVIINSAIPKKDRTVQSQRLLNDIAVIRQQESLNRQFAATHELQSTLGLQLAFKSFPGIELAIEQLSDERKHIELLSIKRTKGHVYATVFVPDGKLVAFESKIQAYIEHKTDKNGKPRDNQKLIDTIQSIRVAALEAIWSDADHLFPQSNSEALWWEVWLPVSNNRQAVVDDFRLIATAAGIEVSPYQLDFPERTIVNARGCKNQFSSSTLLLSKIAELRIAKETAEFFDSLDVNEQNECGGELLSRLNPNNDDAPYICLLDTGVNPEHPLLSPFTTPEDQLVVEPNWIKNDEYGHGTEMAGLALWGDLTDVLQSNAPVSIRHRLESVKVLRYGGDNKTLRRYNF